MLNPNDAAPACEPGCGCRAVDRRVFLKAAGLGAASFSGVLRPLAVLGGAPAAPAGAVEHFVPAEKGLSAAWIRGLLARGAPDVHRGEELDTIGMPVGGIAAGQLYLRGDGTLGVWQIFNRLHFSGYGATNYARRAPDSPVAQGFAIQATADGKSERRKLDRQGFPGVEFRGEYPIGRVRHAAADFPLTVEMEAFSPFIPLNAPDSALPATVFHITVQNTSTRPVKASLLAWLENAVCLSSATQASGQRRSRAVAERGRSLLLHSAEEAPAEERPPPRPVVTLADFEGGDYGGWQVAGEAFGVKPAGGTLPNQQRVSGFAGKGLVNTYLGGDRPHGTLTSPPFTISRRFVNFLLGGGNHPGETCINLLVGGKVARTATGLDNEELRWRGWNVADLEGNEARIEIVDRNSGGWGHINIDQIELADESRGGPFGPLDKLEDFGTMALAFAGEAAAAEAPGAPSFAIEDPGLAGVRAVQGRDERYRLAERRVAALRTPEVELAPGARREHTFVLAWHFPNHRQGRAYARRFASAAEVAHYLLDHHERLAGETRRWRDTFYESTLPYWLLDRLGSTLSTLATGTCEWWGNGRFWAWEGVGCCHGTCTHVWNYAHGAARLFPEIERSAREMQDLGEALQGDGLVGFRGERNGHYAADGQAGTVLKCYREHQMTDDRGFLERNWPRIRKVLEYSMGHDGNGDGLIEDSQHNTFDINFEGPNTFVGSLYLAALRAGEEMAREAGDEEFAARARRAFEQGSRLSAERLWNGEYFIQIVDLKKHPRDQYGEGCLSDQLFGQGWARQLGLGLIYPEEKVKQALASVWKYNWAPDVGPHNAAHKPEREFASPGEAGLFTCTWPRSEHLKDGVRYRDEVWTGIEYQVAGHMAWEGMAEQALVIVRAVHDRYHPRKRNPYNEVECGDHYARALASWGVFTALAGFEHHGPRGRIAFAPRVTPDDFRAAFTAAGGWGSFRQRREGGVQTEAVEVRWGRLRLRELVFEVPAGAVPARIEVALGGKALAASHSLDGQRLVVRLAGEASVLAGETLEVRVS
jgi:uncharacterized protein (DUF608 family)